MKQRANYQKKTRRLIIRPLQESDFEKWRTAFSSLPKPRNRWDRPVFSPDQLTLRNFKSVLKRQKTQRENDTFFELTAFEKKTGDIIGMVAIMDISRAIFQNGYLGYSILSPYWGKGFGKEMTWAAIKFAFNELKLHRVEAGIEPSNKRSIALVKSLGLRREGLSKRRLFLNDQWLDMSIYALTKEEI